jgi:hypothetical protein
MKKPPTPKLVTVAIITTITVVFWVFLGVYNILIGTKDTIVPADLLKPIEPSLEIEILNMLENKMFIDEGQEIPFTITKE